MLDALSGLKPALKWNRRSCESLIFYMNYRLTFLLLIFCCILISTHQFVGNKINCLSKKSDEKSAEFLNAYCWAASTYSVQKAYLKEVGVNVPHPGVGGSEKESEYEYRNYYQYVHIVLFIQAVLFYVPHFIWKITEPTFLSKIPELVDEIVAEKKGKASKDEDDFFAEKRGKDSKHEDELSEKKYKGSKSQDESSEENKKHSESQDESPEKSQTDSESQYESSVNPLEIDIAVFIENRWGSHKLLAIKYLMCEILATFNVLGQTYLLDIFFYGNFLNLGLWFEVYYHSEILSDPIRLFPLVTVCKFRRYGPSGYIDVLNSLCVLPMNALNGKIFLSLWIWFTILFFLSLCHLVYLVACMLIPTLRMRSFIPLKIRSLLFKVRPNSYGNLVKNGDIGDWFVLSSLKRNLDPLIFDRITDNIKPKVNMQVFLLGDAQNQTPGYVPLDVLQSKQA